MRNSALLLGKVIFLPLFGPILFFYQVVFLFVPFLTKLTKQADYYYYFFFHLKKFTFSLMENQFMPIAKSEK